MAKEVKPLEGLLRTLLTYSRTYVQKRRIQEGTMYLFSRKKREADVYLHHQLYLKLGAITTLLVFITLFRLDFDFEREVDFTPTVQDVVEIEDIVITQQEPVPPPPPRPSAPVAVPNDEIIADELMDFSAELNFDMLDFMAATPPPPAEEEEDPEEVFVVVERMPDLIGGLDALQRKIVYPEIARLAGIEGRVVLQFVIDERGNVVNPVVVRGIGGGCDEAALEVVKTAKFTPGMQRGRPVKVRYTLPIMFRLSQADRNSR